MQKQLLLLLALLLSIFNASPCTSLLAGKKATADGSTMISYAADSHAIYGELYYYPAMKFEPGNMRPIYEWDTGKYLGTIEEAQETYKVVGSINEYGLAITESTWGGRKELIDTTGLIDYGSLIVLALQRAKTAREAIATMTTLVARYGYYSSGESFSIADPNEVWILELIGKGTSEKGAVWVAVRIPDDCIAAHANHARIHRFDRKDKQNVLYSPDVIAFARKMGYFSGKDETFSFSNAYTPTNFGKLRGCEARVWSFFNKHSDGMDAYLPYIHGKSKEPIPLYIRPRTPLTLTDMRNGMRDHFEGTPFDMTQDAGAGPYKAPYRWRPMTFKVDGQEYTNERAIATQQTGFSLIAQIRSELPRQIGGLLWFGTDDADMSLYHPIYCCLEEVPEALKQGNGSMLEFSWSSSFWIHNWVANMAYHKYSFMIQDIRRLQQTIESTYDKNQPSVEAKALELYKKSPMEAVRFLTNYSVQSTQTATSEWKRLGEFLMVKYIDGNLKQEKDGVFLNNGNHPSIPAKVQHPGYSEYFYKSIVDDAGERLKVTF